MTHFIKFRLDSVGNSVIIKTEESFATIQRSLRHSVLEGSYNISPEMFIRCCRCNIVPYISGPYEAFIEIINKNDMVVTTRYKAAFRTNLENLTAYPQVSDLVNKVVVFDYRGGTAPNPRVVLVKDIKHVRGGNFLCGVDLVNSTDKNEEFRQFNIDRISKPVRLLPNLKEVSL